MKQTNLNTFLMLKTMILMVLLSVGCSNSKNTQTTKITTAEGNDIFVSGVIVKKTFEKTEKQLDFNLKNLSQKNNTITVDVHFGGGCVDNHIFELYSTGKPDAEGVVDLFLLHKTEDNCKMLLMQQRVFDISKLTRKRSVKSFRVNNNSVQKIEK